MNVADFDFHLPPELIAQTPLDRREDSRMLVLDRESRSIAHRRYKDFPELLNPGDVLVYNNSRVIPARAWGKAGGAVVEFLFVRETEENTWEVLCRPAKKVRPGETISFPGELTGLVTGVGKEGQRTLRFSGNVREALRRFGSAPLPPYIKRKKETPLREMDLDRYQTVYAEEEGSIAAPTAGLHFTPEILHQIKKFGVIPAPVTLDVGLATFAPVRTARVEDHTMLSENYEIPAETAEAVSRAIQLGIIRQ